ncbi:Hypothetical protein (plasmid) [Pseudomonas putida]|nr:Hypothetical protein [Pseudomonas putida]
MAASSAGLDANDPQPARLNAAAMTVSLKTFRMRKDPEAKETAS